MAGSDMVKVVQWENVDASGSGTADEKMYSKESSLLARVNEFETEASLCDRVVPDLCEQCNLSALKELADALIDLPEHHLAQMIHCVLKKDDEFRDSVMESLLRRAITSAAVTAQVRQWHISDITQLTNYITDCLQTADAELTERLTEWLVALLDTLYPRLLDADQPALLELLEKMSAWREREESAVKEAELLRRDMDLLKWTKHRPPPPPSSGYAVETIYL